jgi:YebC/PmpR family DNA-binding regulatory protein
MSGHSKWKTIKHKKAATDAKRGKIFTKIIKEITVVARDCKGDPETNPRLRTLIDKARQANMPQENITRAIKKGTGELPGQSYEAISYEGYGPGGIAVLVDTLTDNKNRTVADMRRIFTRAGGSLGETNTVAWMFEKNGAVTITAPKLSEDTLLEQLLDYDVSDIKEDDGSFTIYCDPKALDMVKHAVEKIPGVVVNDATFEFVAKTPMNLNETDTAAALEFLEELDDLDDVQNVFTNLA